MDFSSSQYVFPRYSQLPFRTAFRQCTRVRCRYRTIWVYAEAISSPEGRPEMRYRRSSALFLIDFEIQNDVLATVKTGDRAG